jgi:hypothetical protein
MAGIKTFIDRLGISGHPALRISPRQEGYRDYTFGEIHGWLDATQRRLSRQKPSA